MVVGVYPANMNITALNNDDGRRIRTHAKNKYNHNVLNMFIFYHL